MTATLFARAEPIVAELLGLSGAARAARLADACGDDAALRHEVESLLVLDDAATTFLERPALAEAARDVEAACDPGALVGRQLGDYRIEAVIGTGGMADVYRVRNLSLARDEALKVLLPLPGLWAEDRARVEAEARAASGLNHPNIVTIHAVGTTESLHFIAMELVDGDTLRQRLQAGAIAAPECARLAVQLAAALVSAHAQGIVHRDLKPENIKITPDGRLKVLDFGIAGVVHGSGADGPTAGTAGYMAPEQAAGDPARPESDQYAFGVIVAEMLSGRGPLTSRAGAPGDRPVGGDDVVTVPSGLDPMVTALLSRCLARDPGDRFASTEALLAACRAWLARLEARGVTRRRVLQAVAATVALTAAGTGAWRYAVWSARRRTMAVLPFRDLSDDAGAGYLADGLTATLIDRLSAMPALLLLPRTLVANFRDVTVSARDVGRQLGAELVLGGTVARSGDRLTVMARLEAVATGEELWTSRYERPSGELLLVEEEIARAIVDDGVGLRLNTAQRRRLLRRPTTDPVAYELYLQAVHLCQQETEETYLEARDLLRDALTRDAAFGAGHVQMATTFAVMAVDGLERPTEAWPESSRHVRRALAVDPDLADAHASAASHEFFFNWNWDGAEDEWRQAMRFGGADLHPDLYTARALQRWAVGRLDEALALVRQARRVDPVSPMFTVREADLLLLSSDPTGAAVLYEQVLSDAPGDVRALFGLADAARAIGQTDEAVAHLRRAYLALGQGEVVAGVRLDDDGAEFERLQRRGAAAHLQTLRDRLADGRYVSPLDLARQHARLGQLDEAAAWFAPAVADRAPGLAMLDVDRAWLRMRADDRFQTLRRRVGLAAADSSRSTP